MKIHIFYQNPDTELWSFGQAQNLTSSEVEKVKQLLPSEDQILIIKFVEPEDYIYPGSQNSKDNE